MPSTDGGQGIVRVALQCMTASYAVYSVHTYWFAVHLGGGKCDSGCGHTYAHTNVVLPGCKQDLGITFGGLRQFRVPIRQDYQVLQGQYDSLYSGVK
jgi:hypothetical protein